jgi:hypothetical protein
VRGTLLVAERARAADDLPHSDTRERADGYRETRSFRAMPLAEGRFETCAYHLLARTQMLSAAERPTSQNPRERAIAYSNKSAALIGLRAEVA